MFRLVLLDVVLVPRLKVFRQYDIPDGKQNLESHLHVMMIDVKALIQIITQS